MRVLIACECSGMVRRAFRALGHHAISCDIKPAEDGSDDHRQLDIRNAGLWATPWDLMIAFPDCTYLASSGLHWNKRRPERSIKTAESLDFVRWLMGRPVKRIAIENPVVAIGTAIRTCDQTIQPYHYGEDASKRTCLWLMNLARLRPTGFVEPRITADGKERWANQTDSGQNRLAPSDHRAADRARTYPGIAAAMAAQWGESPTA